HADERHVIAHDYLISNYVCPSKAHYPIEWRRFKKRDACAAQAFKDHTATFHRDGKQQLGLGDCQVRSGEGQTRHVYLVSAAYTLLMRSLQQTRPQDWARRTLTTIGEACRAVKAETLERMIDWVVDKLTRDHWSVTDIKAVLAYS